eukprot:scaffold7217_cov362-Prasinococcus_capsulatus_cf.AAC.2
MYNTLYHRAICILQGGRVAKVIVPVRRCKHTLGRWDVPAGPLHPLAPCLSTLVLADGCCLRCLFAGKHAHKLSLHVLALLLVGGAVIQVVREHRHVPPHRGAPVRIVVTLLGALQAVPLPVGVLARELRSLLAAPDLLRHEEALVALAGRAVLIEGVRLVHPTRGVARVVQTDGTSTGAVPHVSRGVACMVVACGWSMRVMRLFQTAVAGLTGVPVVVPDSDAVLVGPSDAKHTSHVEVHDALACALLGIVVVAVPVRARVDAVIAHAIAAIRMVLRVEEALRVVHLPSYLIEAVVAAPQAVQVYVCARPRQRQKQQQPNRKSTFHGLTNVSNRGVQATTTWPRLLNVCLAPAEDDRLSGGT